MALRPTLRAALTALAAFSSVAAAAGDRTADVVSAAAIGSPSPREAEPLPRYRLAPYRVAQAAPAEAKPGMAVSPADAAPGASGPVAAHGDVDAAKPGVPAADAAAGTSGAPKSDERIEAEPGRAESDRPDAAEIEMVRVPAPIVRAARRALPGVAFKSVDLSKNGAATLYSLSGTSHTQRAVEVAIDQSGTVLRVDREVRGPEIPAELMTLAKSVLPGGRFERVMLSLRPAFVAVYSFTGTMASGEPFVLDIRSDGRSLAFVDPE